MSHTKGELKIMPYTRRDGDNIRWIKDSRNKAICQTFKPRAEANARRLVKCWNSHDALLDALGAAQCVFELIAEDHCRPRKMRSNTHSKCLDAVEKIKAAIKQCE